MTDSSPDKFWDMVKDFDTCMVTTRDGGKLRVRPMAPRIARDRGEILFITDRNSHKVEEIERDDQVALSFTKHGEYVAVSGEARLSTDLALKDEAWDAEVEAWMPQGKEDPSVAVLVVRPSQAEIWDVKANKITQAWEFTKALAGGKDRPDTTENVKVSL